jgi:uncharacterized protein (DUF2236 family)
VITAPKMTIALRDSLIRRVEAKGVPHDDAVRQVAYVEAGQEPMPEVKAAFDEMWDEHLPKIQAAQRVMQWLTAS